MIVPNHGKVLPRRITVRASDLLVPVAAILIGVGGVALLSSRELLALVLLASGATVALLVPVRWLPALTLCAFALLPTVYLQGVPEAIGRYLSPAVFLLGIWGARVLRREPRHPAFALRLWLIVTPFILGWLVLGSVWSIEPRRSVLWAIVFLVAVALVGASASRDVAGRAELLRMWTVIALVLGTVGILEGFAKANPLARYYTINGEVIHQTWSVYRIETTIGHPLLNGMFFATSAALMAVYALRKPTVVRIAAAVASAIALTFTASRSGVIGLVLGVGIGVVLLVLSKGVPLGRRVVVVVAVGALVFAVVQAPILKQRERSAEASSSTLYRRQVLTTSIDEMRRFHYRGSGPGTSQTLLLRDGQNPSLESSFLQLGVSLGIPGSLGVAALLAILGFVGVRRGRPEAVAALIAYLATAAGFNAWDSDPQTFVLLGLIAILILAPQGSTTMTAGRDDRRSV